MTVQELYASIGGSYESAKRILPMDKLIEKFIAKLPDDKSYGKLMDAHAAKNPEGLFEAAHALKGVLANLGLNDLSQRASVVAEEFRPGNSRTMSDADLDTHIKGLSEKFQTTIAGIRDFIAAKG